jgi:hypothetical protein
MTLLVKRTLTMLASSSSSCARRQRRRLGHGSPCAPRRPKRRVARHRAAGSTNWCRGARAACRCACQRGRPSCRATPPPRPSGCRDARNRTRRRCLRCRSARRRATYGSTHGHLLRCGRLAVGGRVGHRQCLDSLPRASTEQDDPSRTDQTAPGGSILQITSSRRSSRPFQAGPPSSLGGTFHVSPSAGRQSRMAREKGR